MAVPDFQSMMLPLLRFIGDGKSHSMKEAVDSISDVFNLSEEDKNEILSKGNQTRLVNRVGWARTYMKKAGLIESPSRGNIKITNEGQKLLKQSPDFINSSFLKKYPGFLEFKSISNNSLEGEEEKDEELEMEKTPNELIEKGYAIIRGNLSQEILDRLRKETPSFFEKVILDLLSLMGYGDGEVTGRTGDGGIDGFVDQDKLGLDKIYFQAKRFNEGNNISASMIRDFVGALDLRGASKGVFITTSKFPKNSNEIVSRSQKSIVLVGGEKLVGLMIDYNLGVAVEKNYELKRIDLDYFEED